MFYNIDDFKFANTEKKKLERKKNERMNERLMICLCRHYVTNLFNSFLTFFSWCSTTENITEKTDDSYDEEEA